MSAEPQRTCPICGNAAIDAVYALLPERSVRDLTMEAVAKRAGVGKFLACIAQKSLRIVFV
jgi:AcrR family transcriptional regulator